MQLVAEGRQESEAAGAAKGSSWPRSLRGRDLGRPSEVGKLWL